MTMGSRKTADFFAREAKKLGYAARSALKLTEIQDRFRVMRKGDVVLDLGCIPVLGRRCRPNASPSTARC